MRAGALLIVGALSGCYARVNVVPPRLDETDSSREAAWRDFQSVAVWIGFGAFCAGLATLLTLAVPGVGNGLDREMGTGLAISSLALMALGPLVNVVLAAIFVGPIDHLRIEAFQRYDEDLGARLLIE